MKKGKITITITIGLMCFVLIYVMFVQFKTIEETDITSIETMREDELRAALTSWKTKYEEISQKVTETNTKIDEYNQKLETNEEATELIDKELEQINILLGKTDVKGNGVVVTITDNEEKEIVAEDLLYLINELRLAGAEAISINDERIINMSDIVDINNSYILVNGQRITSPYVVKAIGDAKYLESGLLQKDVGYIDTYTALGKTVKFEKQNNITILKYNKEIKIKYIEFKKEN